MTQLTYTDVAATILAEIRAIYPTGRKPDPDITAAWALVLERSHLMLPASVWREALTIWAVSHPEPPTPHDLITAAKQVVGAWECDPKRKIELDVYRTERLRAKEHIGELPPGSVPEVGSGIGTDRRGALEAWRHRWANRTQILGSETRLPAIEHDPTEVPRQVVPDD